MHSAAVPRLTRHQHLGFEFATERWRNVGGYGRRHLPVSASWTSRFAPPASVAAGDQLARAIRTVSTGGSLLDPKIVEALFWPLGELDLSPAEEDLLAQV